MRANLAMWAAALLMLAACAARESDEGGNGDRDGRPLLASLQTTTFGDSVQFMLQVTNTGTAPVELNFSSGQSFDFVVRDGEREVWRWSADQMFTQALRTESLAPGETRTFQAMWRPGQALRGEFTAVGMLTASDHPVEQSTRFRLP